MEQFDQSVLPKPQDIEFYEQNGYWIASKLVSDELLSQLHERMERV
jgi:hypothetical protein